MALRSEEEIRRRIEELRKGAEWARHHALFWLEAGYESEIRALRWVLGEVG